MRTAMVVERIGSAELKDLVARGSTLDLSFPVSSLERLAALSPAVGEGANLTARFTFRSGSEGRPQVHLVVAGGVPLVCQRCMEPLDVPVAVDVLLTLVARDAEAAGLADPFETVLLADGELVPAQVVEDEVLAALPLVPKHSATTPGGRPGGRACGLEEQVNSGEMHRPLAGLADLLGRGDRQGDE
jgi:uncharacterized protein